MGSEMCIRDRRGSTGGSCSFNRSDFFRHTHRTNYERHDRTTSCRHKHRAFITAVIPVGTTGQVVSGVSWSGAATTFTVNKTGTGSYRFDWTPAIPSTYVFFGNLRNAAGFVSFDGAGGATLKCLTYNATGTQVDVSSGFHVMIFRNP